MSLSRGKAVVLMHNASFLRQFAHAQTSVADVKNGSGLRLWLEEAFQTQLKSPLRYRLLRN